MAIDLKPSRLLKRQSLIIGQDCLFVLTHRLGSDRIERLLYEGVQSIAIGRVRMWGQVLIGALLFTLGVAIVETLGPARPGPTAPATVIAYALIFIGAVLTAVRVVRKGSLVEIQCHNQEYRFTGAMTRPRVKRFEANFCAAVEQWQKRIAAQQQAQTEEFLDNHLADEKPTPIPD